MKSLRLLLIVATALDSALAQHVGDPTNDLDKVSVDELFSVQVTSVGRKAEKLSKASAAVFVLTADDIRRSGATCIPEALQWVPGLTVLKLDDRAWVVSARGGASQYADKMLVMIDGRSLYTPLFSGVLWETISVPMEDIERIEVVRGPGAVMWGPNAVNGVINIISRSSQQTKGGVVSVAVGNEQRGVAEARWGASPSDRLSYRIWGEIEDSAPGFPALGAHHFLYGSTSMTPLGDLGTAAGHVGFRFDGQPTQHDQWMVQGDAYRSDQQDQVGYGVVLPAKVDLANGHSDFEGGSIQGQWTRSSSTGSEGVLRFSYDKTKIDYPFIAGDLNNLNVDYQRRWQTGEQNEIYLGVGYQQYWDNTMGRRFVSFSPAASTYRDGDLVLRDELQLLPEKLRVSAGVRLDYSSYHQWQYQPSLRLLYTPWAQQSVWIGVSRAVQVPSRFDRDMRNSFGSSLIPGVPIPVTLFAQGSPNMRSEVERSLEAGYRLQSGQRWSVDTSVFWSYYNRLHAFQGPMMPLVSFAGQASQLTLSGIGVNAGTGRSYGAEIWSTLQVTQNWRLMPAYSYLNEADWLPAATYYRYSFEDDPATLAHQGSLRSQHNLSRTVKLDLMAKVRSRDRNLGLPGVLILDAHLGWRPYRSGEIAFTVQNIANRQVLEGFSLNPNITVPTRRTFVFKWSQRL